MDYSRVQTTINNSGVRRSNKALAQVLDQLVKIGQQVVDAVNGKLASDTKINLIDQVDGTLPYGNGGVQTGLYIPTLTNTANIDASAPYYTTWWRFGNLVTICGKVTIDPTAAGVLTQLELSLPYQSFFLHSEQCSGVANGSPFSGSTQDWAAIVKANIPNRTAMIEFYAQNTVDNDVRFYFTYQIIQQ